MKSRIAIIMTALLLCASLLLCACGSTVSVVGIHWNEQSELILEMSDGTTVNAGKHEENPQGLSFRSLPDDTWGVRVGDATELREIVVPATYKGKPVTQILKEGFAGCKVEHITLPDSITAIGEGAFFNSGLKAITLPQGLTVIKAKTFQYCDLLTITIPASVTSIESNAFGNCNRLIEIENLSDIDITLDNQYYHQNGAIAANALNIYTPKKGEKKTFATEEGFVFYADGVHRYLIDYEGDATELTLPADCQGKSYAIYRYAFAGNKTLQRVTCPDAVTKIWGSAFANCLALQAVSLPDTLGEIAIGAFSYCTNLSELNIPSAVTVLSYEMFRECNKLIRSEGNVDYVDKWAIRSYGEEQVLRSDTVGIASEAIRWWETDTLILPESLVVICESGICCCPNLTTVVVPASVQSIGFDVFRNCDALTAIYYGGTDGGVFDLAAVPEGATIYCYSESAPTVEGNFWHYDAQGAICVW